jgi:hypothetical protein
MTVDEARAVALENNRRRRAKRVSAAAQRIKSPTIHFVAPISIMTYIPVPASAFEEVLDGPLPLVGLSPVQHNLSIPM